MLFLRNNILKITFSFFIITISNSLCAKEYLNNTYLAYIKIQDSRINSISENGLTTIKNLLNARTSVTPEGVVGLDINNDELYYYPFLYWPLTKDVQKIDQLVINKIKNYIHNGGIIFFDVIGFSRKSINLEHTQYESIRNFL